LQCFEERTASIFSFAARGKIIYIIQATGLSGSGEEKESVPDLGQYEQFKQAM